MCCCCKPLDAIASVSTEYLKRELRFRQADDLNDIAAAFFGEMRDDLKHGRMDDALLLLDRLQFPKHRRQAEAMVAFA